MVTDKAGKPLPEGTTVELMLQAAPEYYLNDDDATIDWNEIDPKNTTLSLPGHSGQHGSGVEIHFCRHRV